jgi:hypothetical protein
MDQEKIRSNLLNTDQWARILYMAAFAIGAWVVLLLLSAIIFFQALFVLIGGEVNGKLRDAGLTFARYFLEVLNYMVYATDEKPWPFASFPEAGAAVHQARQPQAPGNADVAAARPDTAAQSGAPPFADSPINTGAVNVAPQQEADATAQPSTSIETGDPAARPGSVASSSYNRNGTPVVPDIPVLTQTRGDPTWKPGQDHNPDQQN